MMTRKRKVDKWIVMFVFVGILFFGLGFFLNTKIAARTDSVTGVEVTKLPVYKESELAQYDGSVADKMILIGLNGWVYDVSAGADFYNAQGPYHYLAGCDSSKELNLIGGEIIKNKYKIVGRLSK